MAEYELDRFLEAREDVYPGILEELRAGRKRSHRNIEEAGEYLRHPMLGLRLVECTEAINALDGSSARQISGNRTTKSSARP